MEKRYRLKKKHEFNRVYNRGRSTANRELVLYHYNNRETPELRLGISVSKKVGNAVTRNRIRRLAKEAVRQLRLELNLKPHIDLIIIARQPAVDMNYNDFVRSIKHLLKKSGLVIGNSR